MRHLITGATGYVGGRLAPRLLAQGDAVRCLVRDPAKLRDVPWARDAEVVRGDLLDEDAVRRACVGVDVVYFLVHSLVDRDFAAIDRRAATIVAEAARDCGVRRIVYLGGLHPDGPLSAHLASRREVGEILLASGVPTAVLQAAVVIGSGSASFEMLRYLTERLPVMVTPRWVGTRIQPIAIRDVLRYLVAAARLPEDVNRTFDIGGPDVLTYREMMSRYAAVAELPARRVLPVPVLTPRLSAHWVERGHARAAGDRRPADRLTGARGGLPRAGHPRVRAGPAGGPHRLRHAPSRWPWRRSTRATWRRAGPTPRAPAPRRTRCPATRSGRAARCTSTSASAPAPPAPRRCGRWSPASAGDRGWYSFPLAWSVRGWLDRLVGGVGLRRGRRDPDRLHTGDALDWWRVERLEEQRTRVNACCGCAPR